MKQDKAALAAAIAQWPQRVKDAGVKLSDGRAYRPVVRNHSLLGLLDDPTALHAEMVRILDTDGWDDPNTGSAGWNRIVEQAGPEYLWEWLIMDPQAPWADLFASEHRWKVAVAFAHTLRRL